MKSSRKTFDLQRDEEPASPSDATTSVVNERAIDVNSDDDPKFKLDFDKTSKRKTTSSNNRPTREILSSSLPTGNVNNGIARAPSRTSADFHVIPLNTPSAYQNYVGSIFDPSLVKSRNELTWRQKYRFLVCSLAIFSFSICLANRMALNIAINEMAQGKTPTDPGDATIESEHIKGIIPMGERIEHVDHDAYLINKQNSAQTAKAPKTPAKAVKYEHVITTTPIKASSTQSPQANRVVYNRTEIKNSEPDVPVKDDAKKWTAAKKHILMGAFYLGYFPVMLVSGYLAELYGAKTSLFLASFGSGLINILTPWVVYKPIIILFVLRVLLGAFQASVVPALYALCNMWLSKTEMGIFASFIKVSMGLGVLFGYLLPGLHMLFGYGWSTYFYTEGAIALIWSVAWFLLATSKPQENRFVQLDELRWILRKKPSEWPQSSPTPAVHCENDVDQSNTSDNDSNSTSDENDKSTNKIIAEDRSVISYMLKHPSVWALAFTKLTHNIGIDFVLIEFPSFMNSAHNIELGTIIMIACYGAISLVSLVSLVGWISKVVVQRKFFGWSKTIWRKVFQGISNLGIASLFFTMAIFAPNDLYFITFVVIMLNIFYMFGAGGEAVAANDMSLRYPATIYGFAHSISSLGGILVPGLAALVLGDQPKNPERWSMYFTILGILASSGGFVFIFIFKSKLFIPSEINAEKTLCKAQNIDSRDCISKTPNKIQSK